MYLYCLFMTLAAAAAGKEALRANQTAGQPNSQTPARANATAQNSTFPPATVHIPALLKPSDLSETVRIETCNNQVMFCDNVCGVEKGKAKVNECDTNSFQWSCQCDNGIQPNTTAYTFPVEFVVCTEQLRECQNKCSANSECSHACTFARNCTAKDKNDGKPLQQEPFTAASPSIFNGSSQPGFLAANCLAAFAYLLLMSNL
ncbi:hypothetical protein DSO57_1000838 [Entomophthora muscae]|uniref:Uncharacterized protein n=1 Tax=Entomophthora muscae TaxID=34485 RepID=A0ACC2U743_9FUNG|nr:hypothetical protein DSO57_1000838 [Entomophthora muscae]